MDVYRAFCSALTAPLGISLSGPILLAGLTKRKIYLLESFHCSIDSTSATCVIAETGATWYAAINLILGITCGPTIPYTV